MIESRKKYYIKLIKESSSLREVCLKAGLVVTTGNYDTLKRIIKENNIDISHFKRCSLGSYNEPKELVEYLVKDSTIKSYKLKNRLFKEHIKEKKCECCGLTEWLGKPINLQLHHINGVNTDNRLENLQILCPNCHSCTDNFSGKNQKINIKEKKERKKKDYFDVSLLNELIEKYNDIDIVSEKMCRAPKTIKKYLKKYNIKIKQKEKKLGYDKDMMIDLMRKHKNYSKVADLMGVTDNAIKKRFISLGMPDNIGDLIAVL